MGALGGFGLGFQALHLAAQRRRLPFERCRVVAAPLGLADLAGKGVAAGLPRFQRRLRGAAACVLGQHRLGGGRQAAPGEGGVESGGVGSDRPDVVHQSPLASASGSGFGAIQEAARMEIS